MKFVTNLSGTNPDELTPIEEAIRITGLTLEELESLGRVVEYDFDNLPIKSGLRFPETEEELIEFEKVFPDTKTCDDLDELIERWYYDGEGLKIWDEELEGADSSKQAKFFAQKFLEDFKELKASDFEDLRDDITFEEVVAESFFCRIFDPDLYRDDEEESHFAGADEPEDFYDDDVPFN